MSHFSSLHGDFSSKNLTLKIEDSIPLKSMDQIYEKSE